MHALRRNCKYTSFVLAAVVSMKLKPDAKCRPTSSAFRIHSDFSLGYTVIK